MKKLVSLILAVAIVASVLTVNAVQSSAATFETHKAPKDSWNMSASDFVSEIRMGTNYGNGIEDPNLESRYPKSVYPNSVPTNWWSCQYDGYPIDCQGNVVKNPIDWERDMSVSSQWPLTKDMLIEMHNAGFDALRLPVTWCLWSDYDSGAFTLPNGVSCTGDKLSPEIIARVKQIVDWCCELDMYVTINMHHDDSAWLHVDTTVENDWSYSKERYENFWKQISYYFKDYGSNVMFAGMNEIVYGQYTGEWYAERMVTTQANCNNHMGELYQLFVDTVRASGGNNTKRYLWIAPMGANITMSSIQYPKDTKSENGVNRISIEIHQYNCFQDTQPGTSWSNMFAQYENMRAKGYGMVIGEGNFDDNAPGAADDSNYTRRETYRSLYNSSRSYGVPIFLWDNGGFGNTGTGTSTKYGYCNGKAMLPAANVWSVYNRRDGGFRWPSAIKVIRETVYGLDKDTTEVVAPDNYYYWNNTLKCTSFDKGLFKDKVWKKGAYQSNGTVDTSATALYMDKVSVTPGEKYELRNNDWWGVSSYYGYTIYGVTSGGSFVTLGSGSRTKGISYQLKGQQHAGEGETVSLNGVVTKDVAFVVPSDVTQLAISLVPVNLSKPTQAMVNNQINSTAFYPTLTTYTGQVVTQTTGQIPTADPTQPQPTQPGPTQEPTTGTPASNNQYLYLNHVRNDTEETVRFSFGSEGIPSNATKFVIWSKGNGSGKFEVMFRSTVDASAGGATSSSRKPLSIADSWVKNEIDVTSAEFAQYHSILLILAGGTEIRMDNVGFELADGSFKAIQDFQNVSSSLAYAGDLYPDNPVAIALGFGNTTGWSIRCSLRIEQGDVEPTTTTSTQPKKKGDITGDGNINIQDVQALLGIVTSGKPCDLEVCDITNNGSVDIQDIQALLNIVLK